MVLRANEYESRHTQLRMQQALRHALEHLSRDQHCYSFRPIGVFGCEGSLC